MPTGVHLYLGNWIDSTGEIAPVLVRVLNFDSFCNEVLNIAESREDAIHQAEQDFQQAVLRCTCHIELFNPTWLHTIGVSSNNHDHFDTTPTTTSCETISPLSEIA